MVGKQILVLDTESSLFKIPQDTTCALTAMYYGSRKMLSMLAASNSVFAITKAKIELFSSNVRQNLQCKGVEILYIPNHMYLFIHTMYVYQIKQKLKL